jgi:hypothetical protein
VKKVKIVLLVLVLAAVGFLMWKHFFPNEEKRVRKMLDTLQKEVSVPEKSKNFAKLTAADSIAGFFMPNAEIDVDVPDLGHHTISGRAEIVQIALAAQSQLPGLRMEFSDIAIQIDSGKQTAHVELTVKVAVPRQREMAMQDVRFSLEKYDGNWRIAKAQTVRAFK